MRTVRFSFFAGFAAQETEGREAIPVTSGKKRRSRFFDTLKEKPSPNGGAAYNDRHDIGKAQEIRYE